MRKVLSTLAGLVIVAAVIPSVAHAQGGGPCAPPVTSPIACENSKPGTPSDQWDIFRAGDENIHGFANARSVISHRPMSRESIIPRSVG